MFLLLVNGKSTCRPSKYDKLFGDENEPPFQTDITNCLTKMFRVFPHFSSFGLIYARSCQNISLEYDWNYKNRSLGSYLGCCQDIFKIRNSPNPKFPKSRLGKLIYLVQRHLNFWWQVDYSNSLPNCHKIATKLMVMANVYRINTIFTQELHFEPEWTKKLIKRL